MSVTVKRDEFMRPTSEPIADETLTRWFEEAGTTLQRHASSPIVTSADSPARLCRCMTCEAARAVLWLVGEVDRLRHAAVALTKAAS